MIDPMLKKNGGSLAAVIITFNPDLKKVIDLISAISDKCDSIFLVDNKSDNVDLLKEFVKDSKKISLIANEDNLGIAAAQNQGIKASILEGMDFTLLFDQDSLPTPDFIPDLIAGYHSVAERNKVAAVGPNLFDSRYNFNYSFVILDRYGFRTKYIPDSHQKEAVEVSCLIASGLLIHNKSLDSIGLMDESLFIDYVDTEWCLRCKNLGYKIYLIPSTTLEHEIGDSTISLGKYKIPVHSPWRRYYRVRNGFKLLRMKHIPKLLSFREIVFSLIHQIVLLAKTKDLKYLKYYLNSVRDAFRKS